MKVEGNNLTMIRGDSEAIRIWVVDVNDNPVELVSGDTIHFTVKKSTLIEEKEFQKIITNFDQGEAIISIEPVDTKGMEFRSYVYDIQLTRVNGDVKTIVPPSTFTLSSEVTYE